MTASPRAPVGERPAALHDFFARAARRFPDAIAVDVPPAPGRPHRRRLTYAELDQESAVVASVMCGLTWRGIAMILLPRTTDRLYVAQLGVLKAGWAYVCVDPSFPDGQLAQILADSAATVLLTDAEGARRAADVGYLGATVRMDQPLAFAGSVPPIEPEPDDLAYLIYTSGTTGRPKGVMIPHRAISNLVEGDIAEFGLGPGDRVAQGSSPAYDSSVEEVWLALSAGGTVVVLDEQTARLGPDLVGWLRTERITVLCPPPTLLRATGCSDPGRELPELRLLYVGGEALPEDVAERWAPGRRMVNGYGPTECTVTCVREDIVPGRPVAIGRPVPGTVAYVLDEQLQPVPPGEGGELCMGGAGLALGYRNQPDETRAKFVEHPTFGRLYRTGDLVSAAPDGTLFYHGRIDTQVKLRGYRVELEAIEACLVRCPGVREAACRVEGTGAGEALTAHVVPADPASLPDPDDLKARLQAALPAYMVPSFFALAHELPRSAGGKLRRDDLPPVVAAAGPRTPVAATDAPADPVQRTIVTALHEVLGSPSVDPEADFFDDLGGSSLQAAMLVSALRSHPVTAGLTVRDVYECRTVAALARRTGAGVADPAPVAAPVDRPLPRRALATTLQCGWLLIELMIAAPLAYWGVMVAGPWLAGRVGLALMPVLLALAGAVLRPLTAPVSVAVAVTAKRLLVGRFRPGRWPAWGGMYVRLWILQHLTRFVPWNTLAGTEFQNAALRRLGAQIGRRVHISRGVDVHRGGWDLLRIGDDVSVGPDAALRLVDLSDGQVVVGPVVLEDGATLEVRAGMDPGSRMQRGAVLRELSSLRSGDSAGPAEVWDGVPARPVGVAAPPPALTDRGRQLSPYWHAVATVLCRSLVTLLLELPFMVVAIKLITTWDLTYERVLAISAHPLANLGFLVGVAALSCLALVVSVCLEALAVRALGPVREGVISRWGLAYLRVMLKTELVTSAGDWLSGGLFWPVWLRWAGMSVGRGCEISTITNVVPELVKIGAGTFFADGIYLGGPRVRYGTVALAELRLGRNTFLGNHAVVPAGQRLPPDILVGVCTVADAATIGRGTSWFGHPAFELPRREVVELDRSLTHDPPRIRVVNRMFWEWLRFALPVVPLAALVSWLAAVQAAAGGLGPEALVLVALPAITVAVEVALALLVLGLKWALLGRVRPGVHALWSCWSSRWDFLYVAWGFIAGPVLSALEGTTLLQGYLRAMGMRIGRGVLLGDGFAQVVDPDMLEIQDGATVNAMFQAHTFEDRVLKIDRVRVGRHATLADATVPLYGADIGAGAYVAAHSVVMKRERLLPGLRYEGVPTTAGPVDAG
ncbi:amino acid adenylation domain-containing protein [Actinoplanes sp. NPDC049548]|uniref:non-ribosomal peptide synthetase n=1 Tax=Actinoplanes sp. NPDC049548 TaxID=3155152 RepID=UPI00341F2247